MLLHPKEHTKTHAQTQIPDEKLWVVQHFHRFTVSVIVTFDLNGNYDCLVQCEMCSAEWAEATQTLLLPDYWWRQETTSCDHITVGLSLYQLPVNSKFDCKPSSIYSIMCSMKYTVALFSLQHLLSNCFPFSEHILLLNNRQSHQGATRITRPFVLKQ